MNDSERNTPLHPAQRNKISPLKLGLLAASSMSVGGQAVIEGVMMRSPHSMAVAVRRPSKKIVIKEFEWVSLSDRFRIFKKPVFRGMAILIEAMMNGMQALSFSAEQAALGEAELQKVTPITSKQETLAKSAIVMSMITALGMGVLIFVVLPHFLTEFVGRTLFHGNLPINSFKFHIIDGTIKMSIFIMYILGISQMKDIKRVFQYHGAEHKSIFAYEKEKPLDIPNARAQSRFHPRCGTSFILTVIMASILVFSAVFPFIPKPHLSPILTSLLFALIKIPLMLPVVGLSYEFLRLMGNKNCPSWLLHLSKPGLWMRNLTTQEPDDEQIEVGLASLKACLWREVNLGKPQKRENLIELDDISSPLFEDQLAQTL